jgi:hemerythrin-like domain-containing protein
MLRNKSLVPLSRQHQHALALCVRIDRASPIPDADLDAWQDEIAQHFQQEIKVHFAAEEDVLFPAVRKFAELIPLVEELMAEHATLRGEFAEAEAHVLFAKNLLGFARILSFHIRKEERQLFERMQELMQPEELAALGAKLEIALKDAVEACALPTPSTQLRAGKQAPVRKRQEV